jgi:hypothetical protein
MYHHHEAIRIGERKRLQQNRIEHREDRRIRADSHHQRGDNRKNKAWSLQASAQRVFEVL